MPSSLTRTVSDQDPELLQPRLMCLGASNYGPRPSDTDVRQVSNPLGDSRTRCPAPQPPAAHQDAAASFRDPPPFRSVACRPPPGNPGFRGQRKRSYLSTGSRFRQQYEAGGTALPVESGGGGSGSRRVPPPLDAEHVGAVMSHSPWILGRRFV